MDRHGTARSVSERGFTIVETMISLLIVGLLASIAIPMYQGATGKAQRAALAGDMHELYSAFMRYQVDYGQFPSDMGSGSLNVTTLSPLSTGGYFRSVTGLLGKTADNRMYFYWAPDWEGPNSDFLLIARSKVDPNVWVYAMHYTFGGLFAYDGVYLLLDGHLVRIDGQEA